MLLYPHSCCHFIRALSPSQRGGVQIPEASHSRDSPVVGFVAVAQSASGLHDCRLYGGSWRECGETRRKSQGESSQFRSPRREDGCAETQERVGWMEIESSPVQLREDLRFACVLWK